MNPQRQEEALALGLEYVVQLACHFTAVQNDYASHQNLSSNGSSDQNAKLTSAFETSLVKLYARIIEYEAHALFYISKHPLHRYLRDTVISDKWKDWLDEIKELEQTCVKIMERLASQRLHSGFREMSLKIKTSSDVQQQLLQKADETHKAVKAIQQHHNSRSCSRQESEYISIFSMTSYMDYKDRNPERVDGTCQWFLGHATFSRWLNAPNSALLWVSADPGTGKSVLAKALIDKDLLATDTRTTCYFFFKDDADQQKSLENALAALLHQIFSKKPELLRHAEYACKTDGPSLSTSFARM